MTGLCRHSIAMLMMLLGCAAAGQVRAQAGGACTTEVVGNQEFFGVSGSSDANIIGVGDQGTIHRYDGSNWQAMTSGTFRDLNDVEVVDAATAFAVGDNGTVLQLVAGAWVSHGGFPNRDFMGVWAASATAAWVVGEQGSVYEFNGVTWSDVSGAAGTDNALIMDVWGDAASVYTLNEDGDIHRYDRASGTWDGQLVNCPGSDYYDIWGSSTGSLFMTRRDRVYEYDGSQCRQRVNGSQNRWQFGLHGGPDDSIYAGGDNGVSIYNEGAGWQENPVTNADIYDVWVSDSGAVYYAGDNAQITTCAVVVPNVVADWPLDDCTLGFDGSVVIDNGPNGLNGATAGGVAVEANGQLCSAAGLNGTSAHVRVPDTAVLDLQDGVSMAVWARHNGGPTDWEAILAKGDDSYRLHLNGGCGIADTLPGNTRHGFTFGMNGGCSNADLNSNVVPSPGVWYHVAATYDRSVMRIYINGNLVNSANNTSQINNSGFDLYIGENSQRRGRYWNGDIDELTLWDGAISVAEVQAHMNRTRPCQSCAAAEFVINHDNHGIHCVDETVQVSVVDSLAGLPRLDYNAEITLDTQTGDGTWALVSGGGTLVDGTADDGLATYQWPLGEQIAEFALSYPQGTPVFDIDVYQTTDPGIRDTDAEGLLNFSPSGFTVTATPLPNPPPGSIPPFTAAQTAGVGFPVHITAFGQTPTDPVCGVIEGYGGARNLQFWHDYANPGSGGIAPTVDGITIANSEAAAVVQAVTFTNGQATVTARYKDVGEIRLNLADPNVSDPNLPNGIRGATGGFVVRPFAFELTNIENPSGNPNPGATGPGDPAFVAAGMPFSATVAVIDADGDITPNYGQEAIPESVTLAANLVDPAAGNNPSINFATGFGSFVAGQATGTDFSWAEVGIITLTPSVGDGDYLGAGDVSGDDSGNVGRFIPDHFTTVNNVPAFATACNAGSFTYIGDTFTFATAPVATVTARAADGSRTENYVGGYFRITNASLASRSYTAASGSLDTSGLPAPAADPVVTELGNGDGSLTFGAGSGLAFTRGAAEAPFDAEISLSLDVFDGDGVALLTNPLSFGASGGILFDAGSEMRYGRVRMRNAIGSELVNLAVPLIAEYYVDANTGFVANSGDGCTSGVTLSLGGFTNNLGPGETCAIENGSPGASGIACAAAGSTGLRYREPPVGGDFNLYLQAPGNGNDGSTAITADVPAWLRFDWDQAVPGNENPAGTATFGIYDGDDRRIYTREIY